MQRLAMVRAAASGVTTRLPRPGRLPAAGRSGGRRHPAPAAQRQCPRPCLLMHCEQKAPSMQPPPSPPSPCAPPAVGVPAGGDDRQLQRGQADGALVVAAGRQQRGQLGRQPGCVGRQRRLARGSRHARGLVRQQLRLWDHRGVVADLGAARRAARQAAGRRSSKRQEACRACAIDVARDAARRQAACGPPGAAAG
jgi:hypothetical protein